MGKRAIMYMRHWWTYDIMPNGDMKFYDQEGCVIDTFGTPEMFFEYLQNHSEEYIDDNDKW